MTLEALRTSDDRFADLPDFPYQPNYLEELPGFEGLRLHYLDEGPGGDAPDSPATFLCLHGEPTWSFLYRKMVPIFLETGARVVAPDFFGFGRSDKPKEDAQYTWGFHRRTLVAFIEQLDLRNITLVCQDWGGLLGLTLPMDMPQRFARLLIMNTALATGEVAPSDGFLAWRDFVSKHRDLDVGKLMKRAAHGISDAVAAAYAAPFPSADHKGGVRRFPAIVPTSPEMEGASTSRDAAAWLKHEWDGDSFMAVGALDPVLGPPVMAMLRDTIRGCPEPLLVQDAGHFVQENGDVVARAALKAWGVAATS